MRGQAAFELLASYGTMIMILLASLGVLMYMDILPTDVFSPNSCVIEPEFHCLEYKVTSDGTIYLGIRNNFGKIKQVFAELTTEDCTLDNSSFSTGEVGFNDYLNPANNGIIEFTCSQSLPVGETFQGFIAITYVHVGQSIEHTSTGKIIQKIES